MHNRRRWLLSYPLTSDSTAGKTVMAFYKRLCCSVSRNGGGLWRLILSASTHSSIFASAATTLFSIFPAKCRTETCAVQVVVIAVHHLSVVLEVHAETSLWTSRIPMMSSVWATVAQLQWCGAPPQAIYEKRGKQRMRSGQSEKGTHYQTWKSDNTHHNTTHHTTRHYNTTTRLQHHYLELGEAGPWLRKLPTQLTTRCRASAAFQLFACHHQHVSILYATTKQGGRCFSRVLKLRLEPETSEWNARSFQMSASLVSLCSFPLSALPTVGHFYLCVCALCTCICICICICTCICICFWSASHTNTNANTNKTHIAQQEQHHCTHTPTPKRKRKRKRKERNRERERREGEKRMKGERKEKEKEKEKRESGKRKTDYSYSRALLVNYFQLQLQACFRRRINIAFHYSRILSRNQKGNTFLREWYSSHTSATAP